MKFRKKPVVIEAFQPSLNQFFWPEWALDDRVQLFPNGAFIVKTLEGEMASAPGDWLIRGIKGELYPCKPDIFAATYEPVE